jgi:hypothetical protein
MCFSLTSHHAQAYKLLLRSSRGPFAASEAQGPPTHKLSTPTHCRRELGIFTPVCVSGHLYCWPPEIPTNKTNLSSNSIVPMSRLLLIIICTPDKWMALKSLEVSVKYTMVCYPHCPWWRGHHFLPSCRAPAIESKLEEAYEEKKKKKLKNSGK